MSDPIKLAQEKRMRLRQQVESLLDEIQRLDRFIILGARLATEDPANDSARLRVVPPAE